jgi:hypothetical protein
MRPPSTASSSPTVMQILRALTLLAHTCFSKIQPFLLLSPCPQLKKGVDCAGWSCHSVVRDHLRSAHGHELYKLSNADLEVKNIYFYIETVTTVCLLLATHLHPT